MGSRVRRPDLEVLPISGGDTLTVKKFLTAGEFRQLIKSASKPLRVDAAAIASGRDMAVEFDSADTGLALIVAYLVDWTFTDFDARPLVIRDQPPAVVRALLEAIDADSYLEVQHAIELHDRTMKATIAAEKKTMSSSSPSAPTLRSVG